MAAQPTTERSGKLSTRKKLLFAAIPLCALVVLAELGLRAVDYRSPDSDPYESFVLHRPLFEKRGADLRTSRARTSYFLDQQFPAHKGTGNFRCFALGGSVTYGFLLEDPANEAYLYRLGSALEKAHPPVRCEMINCGGLAYASYRLVGVLEECMDYEPDLVILMCGHNEFLEPRRYADLVAGAKSSWDGSRLVSLIRHLMISRARQESSQPRAADERTMVVAADSIEERYVVRDESEIQHTVDHFSRNLRRMLEVCRQRGVPVVLCTEPSNLRDWPPFQTVARGPYSLEDFDGRLAQIKGHIEGGRHQQALEIAQETLAGDPGAAVFHYAAAKCLDALGRTDDARAEYVKARDSDAFPHRSISALNDAVREIARSEDVPFYDAEQALRDAARDGIPGADLFLDQCHPNAEGHRIIAEGLKDVIDRRVWQRDRPADSTTRAK